MVPSGLGTLSNSIVNKYMHTVSRRLHVDIYVETVDIDRGTARASPSVFAALFSKSVSTAYRSMFAYFGSRVF